MISLFNNAILWGEFLADVLYYSYSVSYDTGYIVIRIE